MMKAARSAVPGGAVAPPSLHLPSAPGTHRSCRSQRGQAETDAQDKCWSGPTYAGSHLLFSVSRLTTAGDSAEAGAEPPGLALLLARSDSQR